MSAVSAANISKKRKFVADGVFQAEINEFFTRELAEEGYSGCEVRVTHARTEVCTFRFTLRTDNGTRQQAWSVQRGRGVE
jgi:hypothetical protein